MDSKSSETACNPACLTVETDIWCDWPYGALPRALGDFTRRQSDFSWLDTGAQHGRDAELAGCEFNWHAV